MEEEFFEKMLELLKEVSNNDLNNHVSDHADSLMDELFVNYYKNGRSGAENYLRLVKSRLQHLNHFNKSRIDRLNKDLVIERELKKINKFDDTKQLERFVKKFLLK